LSISKTMGTLPMYVSVLILVDVSTFQIYVISESENLFKLVLLVSKSKHRRYSMINLGRDIGKKT
jgi:hypothetical protein